MEHAYITRDLIGHHALWKGAKVLARKSVECKTSSFANFSLQHRRKTLKLKKENDTENQKVPELHGVEFLQCEMC